MSGPFLLMTTIAFLLPLLVGGAAHKRPRSRMEAIAPGSQIRSSLHDHAGSDRWDGKSPGGKTIGHDSSSKFEDRLRSVRSFELDGSDVASRLVQTGVDALQSLARAVPRAPLRGNDARPPDNPGLPDAVAADAAANLTSQLYLLGPPGKDVPPPKECLQSLIQSLDTVRGSDALTVRPYDPEKLSLLKVNHTTVDVEPLLDDATRRLFSAPGEHILKSEQELEDTADVDVNCYTDPALKDRATMLDLARRLIKAGVVCPRLTRKGRVGIFFVNKKDVAIRMI